jgi:anti-anti-sigma factor
VHSGEERTAQITLEGSLDIYRRDEITALLPVPGSVDRVVIDCSSATSVDSTILTVLMRYRRRFASAGGDPVNIIIIVNPNLRRVFEIAGLTRVLTIVSAPSRAKDVEPTTDEDAGEIMDAEPT